jgi:hypothetical protein
MLRLQKGQNRFGQQRMGTTGTLEKLATYNMGRWGASYSIDIAPQVKSFVFRERRLLQLRP